APHLVADPVHGDPEQPRLEAALLGIPAGPQFGRERGEHRLRDLLGEVRALAAAPGQRVHPAAVPPDDLAPRGFIPACCRREESGHFPIRGLSVALWHRPHPKGERTIRPRIAGGGAIRPRRGGPRVPDKLVPAALSPGPEDR